MTFNKYDIITKLLLITIFSLILIDGIDLLLNVNEIFYLNKILNEELISDAEHQFFETKNLIEYWLSTFTSIFFTLILSIWCYRKYKEIYKTNKEQAPYKPMLAGFSFVIPIFQFFGPYKIMKFIWWGNKELDSEITTGNGLIKKWWTTYIVIFLIARYTQSDINNTEYADEYLNITYAYIFYSLISIISSIFLYKIITKINTTANNL